MDELRILSAYIKGAISDDTEREKVLKFIDELKGERTGSWICEETDNTFPCSRCVRRSPIACNFCPRHSEVSE